MFLAFLLVGCGNGSAGPSPTPHPTASPTEERRLAERDGDPTTEAEFGHILDFMMSGGCGPTPESRTVAANILITFWLNFTTGAEASSPGTTLIQYARRFRYYCENPPSPSG